MANAWFKFNNEKRDFSFDYQKFSEIRDDGEDIVSAVVTSSPTGLTVGTPAITSPVVSFNVSGGTAGVTYDIQCLATTDGTNILEGCRMLVVEGC